MKDNTEQYIKEIIQALPIQLYWTEGSLTGNESLPAFRLNVYPESEDLQQCTQTLVLNFQIFSHYPKDCDFSAALSMAKDIMQDYRRMVRTIIDVLVRRYHFEVNGKQYRYQFIPNQLLEWKEPYQAGATEYCYIATHGSIRLMLCAPFDCCELTLLDESKLVSLAGKKNFWE